MESAAAAISANALALTPLLHQAISLGPSNSALLLAAIEPFAQRPACLGLHLLFGLPGGAHQGDQPPRALTVWIAQRDTYCQA
ncbi:MAG: hypothetical protein QOF74_4010 [Caballeronia mineralivorans]|jgi:hypothetical protein|nr:hypothetical protein [Caballeronia mineralivorans]